MFYNIRKLNFKRSDHQQKKEEEDDDNFQVDCIRNVHSLDVH